MPDTFSIWVPGLVTLFWLVLFIACYVLALKPLPAPEVSENPLKDVARICGGCLLLIFAVIGVAIVFLTWLAWLVVCVKAQP